MFTTSVFRDTPTVPLKTLGFGLCVAFALLTSNQKASASFNATLDSVSTNSGSYVTLTVQNGSAPSFSETAIAGQLNWTAEGPISGLTGSGNTFGTFCIEIPKNVYLGSAYTFAQTDLTTLPTSGPTLTPQKMAQIQAVWAAWHGSIVVANNATATANNYAAFQVAIWEIVYENGSAYDTGAGNFKASGNSAVTDQAYTYLGTVNNSTFSDGVLKSSDGKTILPLANVVGFSLTPRGSDPTRPENDAQDQIAEVNSAPAPPALVLLLSGLFPFLVFRRRLLNRAV